MGSMVIDKAFVGSSDVDKIYLGAELVYSAQSKPTGIPVDEASDGAYVLQGLDTVFTLQDWISAGKPDYSGIAVINNGKRLVIDPKNMKKFEGPKASFLNLTNEEKLSIYTDAGYATLLDFMANDSLTQSFISEGMFNEQMPYIMTFNEASHIQMYGKQLTDICTAIGVNPPMDFVSCSDAKGGLVAISSFTSNDYSSIEQAAMAIDTNNESGKFYFIPMYDMDETLEEKLQDYM